MGKEGSLINKAVWENTGLIPKYYKPYSLIETAEKTNPAPLYRCDFCKLIYKGKYPNSHFTPLRIQLRNTITNTFVGHNSIVYHCRRHIGDYPYKCQDCGFVEVSF